MNKDKTSELNIWVGDAHHLPDAHKLLLTLAENIDIERIGNLVIEEVNVSISGDKRPTSVQGPAMFQTIVNYGPHKHTNSSHPPHPLNQGLSILLTKELGT
jgi:hypothetical protein